MEAVRKWVVGVTLPAIIILCQIISLSFPYWIHQRDNDVGPVFSNERTPLGSVDHVYVVDYHKQTYEGFLATLFCGIFTCVVYVHLSLVQLVTPTRRAPARKIVSLALAVLGLALQTACMSLPIYMDSQHLLWAWYLTLPATFCAIVALIMTGIDARSKTYYY